jgi:hypothetical protein
MSRRVTCGASRESPAATARTARKSLGLLAAATLVLLAVSGIIGKGHHGTLHVIPLIAWIGFLVGALCLIVPSAATLVRHRARPDGS